MMPKGAVGKRSEGTFFKARFGMARHIFRKAGDGLLTEVSQATSIYVSGGFEPRVVALRPPGFALFARAASLYASPATNAHINKTALLSYLFNARNPRPAQDVFVMNPATRRNKSTRNGLMA
jgi:hypothetical protein